MHDKKLFPFGATFVKECATCSVSHFFLLSNSSLSVSCQGKRKGCVSYPGRMWNTGQIVEFFSAFLRVMKCLSSQENTITVIYCVRMGYQSDLVWFRLWKGVPAHNCMVCRQRKPMKSVPWPRIVQTARCYCSCPLCWRIQLPFSVLRFDELVEVPLKACFPCVEANT